MEYRRNKVKTLVDIFQRIENWPVAYALRLFQKQPGLNLLRFRNGLNVVCRGNSRDWDVVHELFFVGGYQTAFDYLKSNAKEGVVLDCGGNVGCFSLLAASCHSGVSVKAFEPGPPNARLFRMNQLANPQLGNRIELIESAVAGREGEVTWFFDEANPGGSGLFTTGGIPSQVKIQSFANIVRSIEQNILLAKIDIEGSEFELLESADEKIWEKIPAISLELHHDPSGKVQQGEFLDAMRGYGYRIEKETVCSYFLRRE